MKRLPFLGEVVAVIAVLSMTTGGVVRAETPASPTPSAQELYELQPGDVLEVSVWKEEDLRRQVLIRSDGGMSFPLAGDFIVAGLTPAELKSDLEARLRVFIPDVTVSVAVAQINGNQVFVVGRVNRPGAYKFDRPLDVMQVLSLAGGTSEFANVNDIRILRRTRDGSQETFEFEYSKVLRGQRLEQNIVLQSGDTLVVP